MKVGDIVDRLNRRESLIMVAKQLGMMPHTLSKKLRLFGYEYDSEKKKRVFVGEGEEPKEQSIFGEVPLSEAAEVHDYQKLMYEELRHIRSLLETRPIYNIMSEEEEQRMRRTFTLPVSLLHSLDAASAKRGVQKSRIVEEALRLFFGEQKW